MRGARFGAIGRNSFSQRACEKEDAPEPAKFIATMPDVIWNPLIRQQREADTLFLFDADEQSRILPGKGGFIQPDRARSGTPPWGDSVQIVPGKFRAGIASLRTPYYGSVWMPGDGLLPADEWTIEFWLKRTTGYPSYPDMVPVEWVMGDRGSLTFTMSPGSIGLAYAHYQTPDALPFETRIDANLDVALWANGAWVSIAATLKKGTLTLFANGASAASAGGVPLARIHGSQAIGDGLRLVGSHNNSMPGIYVSDLRVSRFARVPNQSVRVPDAPTLTVQNTPTGKTVNYDLLGTLHGVYPYIEPLVRDSLRVIRTDKLINCTPIVAGAPDAAHPTPGASGLFSYDWQVVDRTIDTFVRLHATPYLSIDSTPSLLGGSTPPFSGADLTSGRSYAASYNPQVPTDFDAFAAIVYDLVYHCIVEKNYTIPYWGFWNEPNEGFWQGTRSQFFDLYARCVRAVKRVSPTLKVGGPEVTFVPNGMDWVENFLEYCGTNQVPVDFVSAHFYSGDLGDFTYLPAHVAHYAQNHGLPNVPEVINGECHWQIANIPFYGLAPWRNEQYFLNDWHAAWVASALVEQQASGIRYYIYAGPEATLNTNNFSGLVDEDHSWANNNVFRLWAKMRPILLNADFAGSGDMHTVSSRASAGGDDLSVFVSRLRYAPDAEVPLLVQTPAPFYRYARIRHFVIDDAHSNYFNAGPNHAELEPPETLWASTTGTVSISLRARSVHLLAFDLDGFVPDNVTSSVQIVRGGLRYDRPTRRYFQSVTLTNRGSVPLTAPPSNGPPLLSLALGGLGAGVVLENATGNTGTPLAGVVSVGTPYLDVPLPSGGLAPGASVSAVLQFSGTNTSGINFTAAIFAGPGKRT